MTLGACGFPPHIAVSRPKGGRLCDRQSTGASHPTLRLMLRPPPRDTSIAGIADAWLSAVTLMREALFRFVCVAAGLCRDRRNAHEPRGPLPPPRAPCLGGAFSDRVAAQRRKRRNGKPPNHGAEVDRAWRCHVTSTSHATRQAPLNFDGWTHDCPRISPRQIADRSPCRSGLQRGARASSLFRHGRGRPPLGGTSCLYDTAQVGAVHRARRVALAVS